MKISNTLVLAAVMGLLGACQKSQPDTANPDDAAAPAADDDFSVPLGSDEDSDASDDESEEEAAGDDGDE